MARPRKPLRLYRRTDNGLFEIRGPHPVTGAQLREPVGTRDEDEANTEFERFKAGLLESGVRAPTSDPTVNAVFDAFCEETIDDVHSPGTRMRNIAHLKRHLGFLRPWEVSNNALKRYWKARKKEKWENPITGEKGKGVSKDTVIRELADLKAALRWAYGEDSNVSDGPTWFQGNRLPPLKNPVKSKYEPKAKGLTKKQVRNIHAEAAPHCQLYIEIAIASSARPGAILQLKWKNVDLKAGRVNFGRSRGKKRRAKQDLSPEMIERLKEAKKIAQSKYVIEYNGKPIKSIKTAFAKAVIRAGYTKGEYANGKPKPKFNLYRLKHTSITWMRDAGMKAEEISEHTNVSEKMITDVYGTGSKVVSNAAAVATDFRKKKKKKKKGKAKTKSGKA